MVKEPTGHTGSMDVRPPLNELERLIDGDLVAGGELRTSRAPKPFNARFDEAIPQAVVRCTSAGDVAETIAFIRRHRLSSAARSGHCLAGRSTTTGILIDVSPMRTVSVADGGLTIDAGAVLGEVYAEAIRHGVTIAGAHVRRWDRRPHARWWARDPGPHVRRDLRQPGGCPDRACRRAGDRLRRAPRCGSVLGASGPAPGTSAW